MQDTRTTDRSTLNRLTRRWPTGSKEGDCRETGSGRRVPGAGGEEPLVGEWGGPEADRTGQPERGACSKGAGPLFVSERMGGAPGLPPLCDLPSSETADESTQLRRLIRLATLDVNRSRHGVPGCESSAERHIICGRLHGTIDLDGCPTAVVDLRRPSDDPDIVSENQLRVAVCDLVGNVTGVILGADISRFRATRHHPDLPGSVESALTAGLIGGVAQVGERLLVALNHDCEKAPARSASYVELEPK